jgi:hypothetical protein
VNNKGHLFGDYENRENNNLKIGDLLSIALFNILGTHYLIHIWEKIVKEIIQIIKKISLGPNTNFRRFSSARKLQMGNFQKYWSQNVGQDFIVLDFFVGGRSCGRKRCVRETQSMREIRLFRTVGYFLTNLINDPSSLKLQSRDQNLI